MKMGRTDPYAAQRSCRSCPSRRPSRSGPGPVHALKSRGANVALPAMAAFALADLLSRRGLERPCEVLVAWGAKGTVKRD